MKIDVLVVRYLQHLSIEEKSENTVKGYGMCYKRFIQWLNSSWGEVTEIEDVSQTVIRDFKSFLESRIDRRSGKHLSPITINHYLTALKSLFLFAKSEGIRFRSEPIGAIKLIPIARQNETRWLRPEEVKRIFHAIERLERTSDKRKALYKAVVAILVNCGLRVEEVSDLLITDVILQSGLIIVRSGKGGKYRQVPFHHKTSENIKHWLSFHDGRSGYLFYSQRSAHMSTRAIQHMIEKLSELTQIEFTVHQLRHTFGKRITEIRGIEYAASLMGHTDIKTTRRYVEPSIQELRSVVEEIEEG